MSELSGTKESPSNGTVRVRRRYPGGQIDGVITVGDVWNIIIFPSEEEMQRIAEIHQLEIIESDNTESA